MSAPSADTRPRPADPKKVHITETEMTWRNWYKHVDWLNVTLIIIVPMIGLIASLWVPLQFKTAVWAVAYYYFTGLGITAGMFCLCDKRTMRIGRLIVWNRLSSTMGAPFVFCHAAAADHLGRRRCGCRRGFDSLVGA